MIAESKLTRTQLGLFYSFSAITVGSVFLSLKYNMTFLLAAPALVLLILYTLIDYKSVYFLLLAMLPCSIEYYFPNGLATDLPTEPLMAGLMLVTLAVLVFKKEIMPKGFLSHPLIIILLLHLFWILVCAINSEKPVFSFKILLAKLWYFIPFTILTGIVIKRGADFKKMFWCIFIPLTILILVSVLRHGIIYKFAFSDVNKSVGPYFRNHVNYAAMMSIFFPFIILALGWYKRWSGMYTFLFVCVLFYIVAIYLSYTRTAMIAILGMIPFYFFIKWRMVRIGVVLFTVVASLGIGWLMYDNHYLRFAPSYDDTIYHDDFSSHLSSTLEGKDVSSMERVYRWVAAVRMSRVRPYMGVGSGNFYNFYKSYTVSNFETYISDNEEHSTVHNYFLLMLVEQGWIGLIIFVMVALSAFIYGESIYIKMQSAADKRAVMILMLVMFSIIINLLLSDMIESDKVGPFFFMLLALLVLFDIGVLSMEPKGE